MITGIELQKILSWPLRFDLHTHSNHSDGEYSPEELIKYAKKRNIDVIALTDHDNLSGIERAKKAAEEENIHLVAGIEISTLWHSNQIHIAGLCVDINNPVLKAHVEKQSVLREERAHAIAEKLENCGFKDVYEKTRAMSSEGGSLTRANFAAFLVTQNVAATADKCFDLYLTKGSRAYVSSKWGPIDEAINAIKAAGGIPVLAHPKRYDMNNNWLKRLITDFKAAGGEGMEVSGGMQNQAERQFLADLCVQHELLASCGSDFHRIKKYIDLGINLEIPEQATPVWRSPKFKLEV